MECLPRELWIEVATWLSPWDLLTCCQVSISWRSIANLDSLWRRHCTVRGWNDLTLVHDYPAHRPHTRQEEFQDSRLEKVSQWRLNFQRNWVLPRNWTRGNYADYRLQVHPSQVRCLSCDGRRLAIGHSDGSWAGLDVSRLPAALPPPPPPPLPSEPVAKIIVRGSWVLLQQKLLVQVYEEVEKEYKVRSLRSLELGWGSVRLDGSREPEEFSTWYSAALATPNLPPSLLLAVILPQGGRVACARRDRREVELWWGDSGELSARLGLRGRPTDLGVSPEGGLLLVAVGLQLRLLSLESLDWLRALTLTGVTRVLGPRLGYKPGWIQAPACRRPLLKYPACVTHHDGLVFYSQGSTVTAWDPDSDSVLKEMECGSEVRHLGAGAFQLLLVKTEKGAHLWHWPSASRLYALPMIDSSDLFYADRSMILARGTDASVHMFAFS